MSRSLLAKLNWQTYFNEIINNPLKTYLKLHSHKYDLITLSALLIWLNELRRINLKVSLAGDSIEKHNCTFVSRTAVPGKLVSFISKRKFFRKFLLFLLQLEGFERNFCQQCQNRFTTDVEKKEEKLLIFHWKRKLNYLLWKKFACNGNGKFEASFFLMQLIKSRDFIGFVLFLGVYRMEERKWKMKKVLLSFPQKPEKRHNDFWFCAQLESINESIQKAFQPMHSSINNFASKIFTTRTLKATRP